MAIIRKYPALTHMLAAQQQATTYADTPGTINRQIIIIFIDTTAFVSPGLPQNYWPFFPIVGLSGYSLFKFLNNLIFMVLLASRPTPNLEDQCISFSLAPAP
jgi:hypothetical protein